MSSSIKNENSIFFNHSFDKKRLKALISWVFKRSGEAQALKVLDLLKETGFRYATKAGISIGLHDLTTPIQKSWLISESQLAMNTTDRDFIGAKITATERSQRIIDTWHRASESLSKQVVDYFGIYDQFNPVYIMALSGARGNFSQVRQLIGMRGLMADQQGKIVNFPIRSNLREGLTLTEYFISCSGARKGLVDTALRTADTGYLTRRLVDVAHHVVVKRSRCNSNRGIAFKSLQSYNKILLPLKERLVGRVLAEDVETPFSILKEKDGEKSFALRLIAKKDEEISPKLSLKIAQVRDKVFIRSPLTCGFQHSVCQLCYGWSISQGSLVSLGDAVGVIAAQSIGEPGTQLTMRTFHTGGVFSGDLLQEIRAPHAGTIQFSKAFQGLLIRTAHGRIAFLSKTQGSLILTNDRNSHILPLSKSESQKNLSAQHLKLSRANTSTTIKKDSCFTEIPIQAFTMLFVRQLERVENNQLLAEFSIRSKEGNQPIKTQQTIFAELSGRVVEDRSGKIYTKSIKESCVSLSIPCSASSPLGMQIENVHGQRSSIQHAYKCLTNQRFVRFTDQRFVRESKIDKRIGKKIGVTFSKKQSFQVLHTCKTTPPLPCGASLGQERRSCPKEAPQGNANRMCKSLFCKAQHARHDILKRTNLRFVSKGVKAIFTPNYSFAFREQSQKRGTSALQIRDLYVLQIKDLYANQRLAKGLAKRLAKRKEHREARTKLAKRFVNVCAEPCTATEIGKKVFTNTTPFLEDQLGKSKISSRLKNEDFENDVFKYIEPVKSGRLGFLKVLSTRVGATLDYSSPIKPFDYYFIKRKRMQRRKMHTNCTVLPFSDEFCKQSPVLTSVGHHLYTPCLTNQRFCTQCRGESKKIGVTFARAPLQIEDLQRGTCTSERSSFVLLKQKNEGERQEGAQHCKTRKAHNNQGMARKEVKRGVTFALPQKGNQRGVRVARIRLATCFSKGNQLEKPVHYLHPEYIKENRFFLQSIAEYGDIVDEAYKTKSQNI